MTLEIGGIFTVNLPGAAGIRIFNPFRSKPTMYPLGYCSRFKWAWRHAKIPERQFVLACGIQVYNIYFYKTQIDTWNDGKEIDLKGTPLERSLHNSTSNYGVFSKTQQFCISSYSSLEPVPFCFVKRVSLGFLQENKSDYDSMAIWMSSCLQVR